VKISFGGFPLKEVFSRLSHSSVLCILKGVAFLGRACGGPRLLRGRFFLLGRQS